MKIKVRQATKDDMKNIHQMIKVCDERWFINHQLQRTCLITKKKELAEFEGIAKDLQLTLDDLLRDGGFIEGKKPLFYCVYAIDEEKG